MRYFKKRFSHKADVTLIPIKNKRATTFGNINFNELKIKLYIAAPLYNCYSCICTHYIYSLYYTSRLKCVFIFSRLKTCLGLEFYMIDIEALTGIAFNVRKNVIKMSTNGGCFVGSAFSCIELIVFLYECYLDLPKIVQKEKRRDILLLSKGHAVSAIYGYLVEKEVLPLSALDDHNTRIDSDIYLHPNQKIPCIEFSSGSLGHMLSVAVGAAIFRKRNKIPAKNIVILGDGELNEGSVWESVLVASSNELDNLIMIVDRNNYQANFRTEDLIMLEPLASKFSSFGCDVYEVNGHSFYELDGCFSSLLHNNDKPIVIIANTVRGKGIPEIEEKWDKWFLEVTEEEADVFLKKLYKCA